ncbi:MAG: hypothetical protein ACLVG6_00330 [Dorea formicigenerans]
MCGLEKMRRLNPGFLRIEQRKKQQKRTGRSKSRTVRMGESERTTAGALGSSHP